MAITMVDACLRDGHGGSPTVVLDEEDFSPAFRRAAPGRFGASHAVFAENGSLRFFTAAGELPACGHGTVAALAVLALRAGGAEYEVTLRVSGRSFAGRASVRAGGLVDAAFDPGPIGLRDARPPETALVCAALGVAAEGTRVATLGRPRMLVALGDPAAVAGLAPDLGRLRDACDQFGLLGCYVYAASGRGNSYAARMFAPSIGVPEDIANANSTACLAAHLGAGVEVAMGDAVGSPATVTASVRPGGRVLVGGAAVVVRTP
jgi:trans-2,3-dihydro-3-hydroxyanthranilate isomerase